MRPTVVALLGLLATGPVAAQGRPNTLSADERAAGWSLLFDGTTTRGWRNFRADTLSAGWQVVGGALTRVGLGGDIITREQFSNFELMLDWKLSPTGEPGNSGIFYRATEEPAVIYLGAAEVQILDNARHPDGKLELTSAGANFAMHGVPASAARPVGEWNNVRLLVDGDHVTQWFNGAKVVEFEINSADWLARVATSKFKTWPLYAKARTGHIGLQEHGSFVAFRNIKIRRLP